MGVEIVTKEDLQAFRTLLLDDIGKLLSRVKSAPEKQWLKNKDVKILLGISSNTIQRLRISGKLKSSKIGGVHYYRFEDIKALLEPTLKNNGYAGS